MSFELFDAEESILATAVKMLETGAFAVPEEREAFFDLVRSYEALLKSTRRLVRLSDRIEADLTSAQKETLRAQTQLSDSLESISEGFAFYDPDDRLVFRLHDRSGRGIRAIERTAECPPLHDLRQRRFFEGG